MIFCLFIYLFIFFVIVLVSFVKYYNILLTDVKRKLEIIIRKYTVLTIQTNKSLTSIIFNTFYNQLRMLRTLCLSFSVVFFFFFFIFYQVTKNVITLPNDLHWCRPTYGTAFHTFNVKMSIPQLQTKQPGATWFTLISKSKQIPS